MSYNVTITPTGGFAGQVTLSVSGLPSGANGSFTPNPATASSTLSVTTTTSTPSGTYALTITGVSGSLTHTTTVTFVVNVAADFTLGASPSSQTVPGGAMSYNVTITPTGGFAGQVTLSVSGLPSGANGSFAPNPATASATLSVTKGTSTPIGNYTITITAVSGTLTHTTTVAFVVDTPVDFTLNASPSNQTMLQGGATSYSVTISPMGGFTGQVSLSVSGLPQGVTAAFNPPLITPSSGPVTTILTLTTVAASGVSLRSRWKLQSPDASVLLFVAACLLTLFSFVLLHQETLGRPHAASSLLALLMLCVAVVTGCNSKSPESPKPPELQRTSPKTSILTITAASGTVLHTTTVTLSVK